MRNIPSWQPVVSRGSGALGPPILVATAWTVAVLSAVIVFIHSYRQMVAQGGWVQEWWLRKWIYVGS